MLIDWLSCGGEGSDEETELLLSDVVVVVAGGVVVADVVVGEVYETGDDSATVGSKGVASGRLNIGTREAEFESSELVRSSATGDIFERDENGKIDSWKMT